MNLFKVNVAKSYKSVLKHNKFSCPVEGQTGYIQVSKIRKGDLILMMNGTNSTFGIAMATSDAYVSNVSFYDEAPCLTASDLFVVDIRWLGHFEESSEKFLGLFDGEPLFSKNFCLQCHNAKVPEFVLFVNRLMGLGG